MNDALRHTAEQMADGVPTRGIYVDRLVPIIEEKRERRGDVIPHTHRKTESAVF